MLKRLLLKLIIPKLVWKYREVWTPFGAYGTHGRGGSVVAEWLGPARDIGLGIAHETVGKFRTPDEAEAACQKHFESKVLEFFGC